MVNNVRVVHEFSDRERQSVHFGKNFVLTPAKSKTPTPIAGKTVMFTGSFARMTRDEGEAMARRLGAKVARSVSKKIDYVVAGRAAGQKLTKARELGLAVLTEDEWFGLVGGG